MPKKEHLTGNRKYERDAFSEIRTNDFWGDWIFGVAIGIFRERISLWIS